jgi:hypothetical protein
MSRTSSARSGQTLTATITLDYPKAPADPAPADPAPADPPAAGGLASPGSDLRLAFLAAVALVAAGGALLVARRRRQTR